VLVCVTERTIARRTMGLNVARDTNPPDSKRFANRMRMLRRKYSRNKFESEFS